MTLYLFTEIQLSISLLIKFKKKHIARWCELVARIQLNIIGQYQLLHNFGHYYISKAVVYLIANKRLDTSYKLAVAGAEKLISNKWSNFGFIKTN